MYICVYIYAQEYEYINITLKNYYCQCHTILILYEGTHEDCTDCTQEHLGIRNFFNVFYYKIEFIFSLYFRLQCIINFDGHDIGA